MKRLRSISTKSTKDRKKLEEERRQATERLEHHERQRLATGQRVEEVLRNAETAKDELSEVKRHREKERAVVAEYRRICGRLLQIALSRESADGRGTAQKLQETSSAGVEGLAFESRIRIGNYVKVKADRKLSQQERLQKLDDEVRLSSGREERLREELAESQKRRKQREDDFRQSWAELETLDVFVRQSTERQQRLQLLVEERKSKTERAKEVVNRADWSLRNELVSANDGGKACQEELNMSSERASKLRQELSQVDKRRLWLDQLKTTWDDASTTCELHQQILGESNLMKESLQRDQQLEEDLSKRLQQMQESVKVSKKRLKMASENLSNLQGKIDRVWRGSQQADQTPAEDEKELQVLLFQASKRVRRAKEEADSSLSEEIQLQITLQQVAENERIFKIPLRQLNYSESGK